MYLNGQQSLVLQAFELSETGDYGSLGSSYPASGRICNDPTHSGSSGLGFRPALYVKL